MDPKWNKYIAARSIPLPISWVKVAEHSFAGGER